MSDEHGHEGVGSVGEEAAKLLGALGDWARDVSDHVDTGAAECSYCPICRTVHVFREASPEVRAHLTTAAGSLLQAAAGILSAASQEAGRSRPQPTVERIDLDDDLDPDPDPGGDWPESPQ